MAGRRGRAAYGVSELLADLAKDRVRPAYLVVGEEDGLRTRARRALEDLVPEDARGMDLEVLDGKAADTDWAAVASATRTLPWMSARRVVLVTDADGITGEADDLLEYLDHPSDKLVLALVAIKVDRRTQPWKKLSSLCQVVPCESLQRGQIHAEARRLLTERGIEATQNIATRIVELAGSDTARLESEVEKLSLLVDDSGRLDPETVEALLGRSREREVWDFTDALARRDRDRALSVLAEMLEDGASEHYLVAMAAWNTRRLLTGMDLQAQGCPRNEIAKQVKAWGAGRDTFFEGLRAWDRDRLRGTLRGLAALDRALKSSALPDRLLLEKFVLEATE